MSTIDYLDYHSSIVASTMADNSHYQSFKDSQTQNQQPEDNFRQGYDVREASGQIFIVPNAFRALELPLAGMHKPDYSEIADMNVGVSAFIIGHGPPFHIFYFTPHALF